MEKSANGHVGMMAGSAKGVLVVDKGNYEKCGFEIGTHEAGRKLSIPQIKYIHAIDYCDSIYWLFTPNGVWAYNEAGQDINSGHPLFAQNSISSVLKDRQGNYWIGTLDDGILFVPDLKTKLVAPPDFVPSILLGAGKKVHVGTRGNAIYTYDIAANKAERRYQGDVRHEIVSLVRDTVNDKLYFSAERFFVADHSFTVLTKMLHSVKDMVMVDGKYLAFAATGVTALLKVGADNPNAWDSLFDATRSPEFPKIGQLTINSRSRTIAYDHGSGTLYSGSNKGLFRITPHSCTEVKVEGGAIYTRKLVSYGGNIYVLTTQGQLHVIDVNYKLRTVEFTMETGKLLNIKKAGNKLYLLAATGVRVLDTTTDIFNSIDLHPGIRTEEINDLEVVDDKMIIASDRGLLVIDKPVPVKDSVPPGFAINSILVNGAKANHDKLLALTHKENDIDINYSILSFSTDRRYQLCYQINDGTWQTASTATRDLKLVALSPGTYHISFELRSDNGNVYPQSLVSFHISKPFWLEWWFWLTGIIVLATGSYTYYKWQTTLLKKKNALMLEKVELERNLRSSMLTSIRAQMNPHFFYNALNAIQSFIFSDDKRNASTYLVKLSKLTRMILEMSEKENISLDEETEALKLYLELEKMRFDDDFNFEILIGRNVDTEFVKIPPMIVQPYIENAIKHGLLHKKGAKLLSIGFVRDNSTLCITIDDNGIGREKANDLKQIKKEKHHPFSTYANSKRIELLNKERSKDIGIRFTDKQDENGAPAGTTVVISIPLN